MSKQLTLPTLETLEVQAIRVLRENEPTEGYYFPNSFGKDSSVCRHLLLKSGVKFEAHHHLTTIDPPELIRFGRLNHIETIIEPPKLNGERMSFFRMMIIKGFPLRQKRWCCEILKHRNPKGRIRVMGIRWEESPRRKKDWSIVGKDFKDQSVVNPIINWSAEDLWDYIQNQKIPYCELYDEGFHRLGCVLCPFTSKHQVAIDMKRWPRIAENFRRAFRRLHADRLEKKPGAVDSWKDGDEMFEWWIKRK